jgi:hypothetical protein
MPNLDGTVGINGTNKAHDVALIQVMLRVVKNDKGLPYLNANYTGVSDKATTDAIAAFQKDQKLLPVPVQAQRAGAAVGGRTAVLAPPVVAANCETEGLLGPQSKTYKNLVAGLPPQYAGVRTILGLKTVFLEQPANDATTSLHAVLNASGLNAAFGSQVVNLIRAFYDAHKIAIWVDPRDGYTRDFDKQNELYSVVVNGQHIKSNSGPGESNHNWGFAVDIGFQAFKWLKPDASIVTDDAWLQALGRANYNDFATLWNVRNQIASANGLYPTHKKADFIHLQNFDDSQVSAGHSLAAQLARVGKFKWEFSKGSYETDLGSGGKLEAVGNASQLWSKTSHPSKGLIVAAKNAHEKAAWAKLSQDQKDKLKHAAIAKLPAGTKPAAGIEPGLKVWTEADITDAMIGEAKLAIRQEMEAAEAKRDQWVPTP